VSAEDFSDFFVSTAGDVNGDGLSDVSVGAGEDDPNGDNSGASFVVFGKTDGTAVELSAIEQSGNAGGFVINGVSGIDFSGGSVSAAGDVNGDGLADVIVGAVGDGPNGSFSGASFVVFGKSDGTAVELSAIEQSGNAGGFVINGVSFDDRSGRSVSSAGDVNGDGLADLIVGVSRDDPNGTSSGASFVVFGKTDGTVVELSAIEQSGNAGGFVINGVSGDDRSGHSVSSAGDVNGDGLADVIVGAYFDDPNGSNSGASFVVFGKSDGTAVELSDVENSIGGFVLNGVSANDFSGSSVSGAGDVNGDGFTDVIVGATGDDPNGSSSGASYVVFGGDFSSTVDFLGGDGDDNLAGTAADEILIGAQGNDTLDGSSGDDLLKGASGNDSLNGGDGNDKLEGGSGDDVFLFDTALSASNTDTILDFDNPGASTGDLIHLDKTIFTALGTTGAALTPSEFLISSTVDGTAGTSSTRIIYNSSSGGLYYDDNGSVAGGIQQFASIQPGLAMTEDDFFVIS